MKVLLELLGDVRELLSVVESLDDVRPESQDQLRSLLEALTIESVRLLDNGVPAIGGREGHFQRALEAISQGRLDEARRILDAAVSQYPRDTELHNHLGLVAWEQGKLDDAVRHYEAAIDAGFPGEGIVDWYHERNRPFLRALEGKALCLYRLQRYDDALPLFESLADMNSVEYGGCRYLAGEIRHTIGDIAAAARDYERVPTEPAVLYNLALANFQLGRHEAAATTMIRAFVGNPTIAELLLGRTPSKMVSIPGYLGSEGYAEEFVQACQHLWAADDALRFVERCFDHPLVHVHIRRATEKLVANVMQSGTEALQEASWFGELEEDGTLGSIARRVLADTQY